MEICNYSSAWGLIQGQTIIKIGGFLLLILILVVWYNTNNILIRLGLILIFIGGASNLWERFRIGCVRDYFKIFDWWPTFNLADILVFLGFIIVLVVLIKSGPNPKPNSNK